MIVKPKDFLAEAYVPNASKSGQLVGMANTGDNNKLQYYIDKYELEFLLKTLGVELYKELKTKLTTEGEFMENVEEKWKLLVDGNGSDYIGLRAPASDYIFMHYAEFDSKKYVTSGKSNKESRTSTDVNYVRLIVEASLRVFEKVIGDDFTPNLYIKEGKYGGVFEDYSRASNSIYKPMYKFIEENIEDYPNWVGSYDFEKKNTYGV